MHTLSSKRFSLAICGLSAALVSAPALAAHPNFKEADVDVLYGLFSEQAGDGFGWVADPIGDIDADGIPDFITSAPWFANNLGQTVGKIYIYSGADGSLLYSEEGVPGELLGYSATAAGDVDDDGVPDYIVGTRMRAFVRSGSDHSLIHEWTVAGELFGFDSAGVGDLNGDGYGDVIVGAPFAAYGGTMSGRLSAFSGMDGSLLWTFDGSAGWVTGLGTGLVGDIDGDGVPDIFVGDYGAKSPEPTDDGSPGFGTGRAYIYSGADGRILRDIRAEFVGDGMGPGRGVPDVDGDGHDDIYVAAYTYSDEDLAAVGKGYLVSGRDGSVLRTMTGQTPVELLGVDALSPGDVNDDGSLDYMLTGNGSLWVILGD